jgi:hypothetical protein
MLLSGIMARAVCQEIRSPACRNLDRSPVLVFLQFLGEVGASAGSGAKLLGHKRALQPCRCAFRTSGHGRIGYARPLLWEGFMDTEKKPDENTEKPKQDIGEVVGDLIVSGATVLAHSAAEAIVKRVRKSAAKTAPVKAVAKVVKKAKKSAAPKTAKKKAKKVSKKSDNKSAGKKTAKKSAKKNTKKKSQR